MPYFLYLGWRKEIKNETLKIIYKSKRKFWTHLGFGLELI